MDQKDFNRDMGSYLRKRRSDEGVLDKLKKSIPKVQVIKDDEPEVPTEVPQEHVEKVMRGESLAEEEFDEEDFVEESRVRVPWYRRLFSFNEREEQFSEADDDVDVSHLVDDKPSVDKDVKEMLRICVHWVNQLPPEDIQEIKRSDDYQEFKRLLDKYGLLKK